MDAEDDQRGQRDKHVREDVEEDVHIGPEAGGRGGEMFWPGTKWGKSSGRGQIQKMIDGGKVLAGDKKPGYIAVERGE